MNLLKNPEIRRNAWLQFSQASLIAVPLVLLILVFIIAYKLPRGKEMLPLMALTLFVLSTTLLGARRAFTTVLDEVSARTWDAQRMSSLSAWDMMLGKLLGAPLFLWFFGVCCLLVAAFFAPYLPKDTPIFRITLLVLASTVLLHAVCLACGAAIASASFQFNSLAKWMLRIALFSMFLLPLLGLGFLQLVLIPFGKGSQKAGIEMMQQSIDWWGLFSLSPLDFSIFSSLMFAAWGVYIATLVMARQIKAPHRGWVWLLIPLFVGVWFGGLTALAPELNRAALVFLIAGTALATVGLPLLMINPLTHIHLERLGSAANAKKPMLALFALLPAWIPATLLTMVVTVLSMACLSLGEHSYLKLVEEDFAEEGRLSIQLVAFALFSGIHLLSNALLLSMFTLNRSVKRPIAWAVFTWFFLSLLLPLLLRALGLNALADFFNPMALSFYQGFAYLAIHCVLLFAGVVWVVKREQNA